MKEKVRKLQKDSKANQLKEEGGKEEGQEASSNKNEDG